MTLGKFFEPGIYMNFLPNSFIMIGSVTLLFFFAVSLFTNVNRVVPVLGAIMSVIVFAVGLYLRVIDMEAMLAPAASQP